jgi:hypothetical protein
MRSLWVGIHLQPTTGAEEAMLKARAAVAVDGWAEETARSPSRFFDDDRQSPLDGLRLRRRDRPDDVSSLRELRQVLLSEAAR